MSADITFAVVMRRAALQESRALRGWAAAGCKPPRCAPLDWWGDWQRQAHTNSSSFGRAA